LEKRVYHLALKRSDLAGARIALIPGDPWRCGVLASVFRVQKELAFHREFRSFWVQDEGEPALIVSSGIGGPSLSIAVEELAQLGVQFFLRLGTCGSIQEHIAPGELIISEGAVRMDGASLHYAPLAYPACASWGMVKLLREACLKLGYRFRTGITCSSATFYPGQERYDTYSGYVIRALQGSLEEWKRLGVLNYEMETATLFTMCRVLGLQAGAVCGVLVNRNSTEEVDSSLVEKVELKLALVGKEVVNALSSWSD